MDCNLIRQGFCSLALAFLGFGLVASIVAGASESSAPVPEVTVIAPRPPTPEELAGEAVPRFIASHATPSIVIHQIMRWRRPICAVARGLSPAFNAFVSARIMAVAAAVGAPHEAAEQCTHNVEILFTTEPRQSLDALLKRDARLLGFHYPQQTKKLETISRPIQGWYITSTRGDNGAETLDDAFPMPMNDPTNIFTYGTVAPGRLGSRLVTGQSSHIVHALIVVDTRKMTGRAIGPLSDYLAMMILSQAQSPDTCGTLPSIIDLMASNCGREEPTQLTAGDIAFLRALYKMDLRENLSLEVGDIQNAMMREFKSH